MNHDLLTAKSILQNQKKTCVLCKETRIFHDDRRGILPLLELLDSGNDLRGFCAADKVVGKAAAYLYQLMGISSLYACVISEGAQAILTQASISVTCDKVVPAIRNRAQTGLCPMETAVADCKTPLEALDAVRSTLSRLQSTN